MTTLRDWLIDDSPTSPMQARLGRFYRIFGALMRNPLAVVGAIIIAALVLTALFAPWLATHDPLRQSLGERLLPPSAAHWMGTDELGRDIWSRVVYGARITLAIVTLVAVLAAPAGLVIGVAAGYFGGWVDRILMGITDIFLSLPKLILALAFVAALGPGIENAIIAIA
ncbi:ABC transporter permease, partial [Ensifer sp. SSB1]|uniref:ABC transporter permease n=1 Tax=Ensifer sp. SSB1 TaxID=2795385 RepID=UPI001A60C0BB